MQNRLRRHTPDREGDVGEIQVAAEELLSELGDDRFDGLSEFVDCFLVVQGEASIFVRVGTSVVIGALDYLEVAGIVDILLFVLLEILLIDLSARVDALVLDERGLHTAKLAPIVVILL